MNLKKIRSIFYQNQLLNKIKEFMFLILLIKIEKIYLNYLNKLIIMILIKQIINLMYKIVELILDF